MALDINGYNSVFKSFVDFAQNRTGENQEKAVADARIKKFNGEEVLTIAHVKTDEVHKWLRTGDECDVNDRTRALFKAGDRQHVRRRGPDPRFRQDGDADGRLQLRQAAHGAAHHGRQGRDRRGRHGEGALPGGGPEANRQ